MILLAGYFTYRFLTHSDLSWSKLAERVAAARPGYVALGVGLLLARYWLWDWRFRLATRRTLGYASGPFLDTAALILNLDLVVTADMVIAHLAGALGAPVWLALRAELTLLEYQHGRVA